MKGRILKIYEHKAAFIESYEACRGELEELKDSIGEAFALDVNWLAQINSKDAPQELQSDHFSVSFLGQFRRANLQEVSVLNLISNVSNWGNRFGVNPFTVGAKGMPQTTTIPIARDGAQASIVRSSFNG